MASKKFLKLSAALIFIAGTGIFCLSGNTEHDPTKTDYLFGARVELSHGKFAVNSSQLKTPVSVQDLQMLDYFSKLQFADFSGSSCYEEIALWAAENPQVDVRYSVLLPNGSTVENITETLDLSWLRTEEIPGAVQALGQIPNVKNIKLGALGSDSLE